MPIDNSILPTALTSQIATAAAETAQGIKTADAAGTVESVNSAYMQASAVFAAVLDVCLSDEPPLFAEMALGQSGLVA